MRKKALNLYDLSQLINETFEIHIAQSLNTHRYTATELAEYLQEKTHLKITPMRVGLAMQAMGNRWWQDAADGCKYFYLSPRNNAGHSNFINPFNPKNHDRSTLFKAC